MNAANAKLLYVQVLLALAVAACATTNGPYASPGGALTLAGTHWIVTRIDGGAPLRDANLHADFSVDGRVNGDSGCNSFSGPYIQNNSTVQIGELLSTRRACADTDRQRQETRLLDILQGATTARLDRGQLNLRGKDGSLVLSPGSAQDTASTYPRNVQFDCEGASLSVRFETGQAQLNWRDGRQQDVVWTRDGHGAKTCRELR